MYNSYLESKIGILKIVCSSTHLINITLVQEKAKENLNEVCNLVKDQLEKYFNNQIREFDFLMKLDGTDFQNKVWLELLKIPFGETISYQDLANKIGKSKAVRAVASAVGANKILIVIPCHRVIGSNNALTGFSAGLENKLTLLEHEGHKLSINKDLRKTSLAS